MRPSPSSTRRWVMRVDGDHVERLDPRGSKPPVGSASRLRASRFTAAWTGRKGARPRTRRCYGRAIPMTPTAKPFARSGQPATASPQAGSYRYLRPRNRDAGAEGRRAARRQTEAARRAELATQVEERFQALAGASSSQAGRASRWPAEMCIGALRAFHARHGRSPASRSSLRPRASASRPPQRSRAGSGPGTRVLRRPDSLLPPRGGRRTAVDRRGHPASHPRRRR